MYVDAAAPPHVDEGTREMSRSDELWKELRWKRFKTAKLVKSLPLLSLLPQTYTKASDSNALLA